VDTHADLLVLDGRARMNEPATFVGNWSWRMPPDGLSPELAASVRRLVEKHRPTGSAKASGPT
jgi:4-alpha-glucanotransferase